uniref:NADH-ubiquinone oxidoreductase chain 2 n=1 Tax=Apostictopterus fuliginosus TaxID=2485974 RepID=A0A3G3C799_9NEOP|nr:NADH dehydrogenase subunit 2 [Apostictopterus fuliginosus]AYP72698.1 NADH dehydrogenase subunit 2 [Apostictopterus fuliginosus]
MMFNINSNKMFFFFILIFSTLISISSNSWIGCWIGLEINLLSFIPLITSSKNLMKSEASLKYFLTQSIASINFLFTILLKMILMKNFELNFLISILINSSMMMKMGSAPFHFWFPIIIEGLSWLNCLILMSWQKITPMILMSYYINKNFLLLIMMTNTIIGAVGGLNQISLRKILAFSSINNLGWMMSSIMISENLWMLYFLTYSLMISLLCFFFHILNIYFINQMFIFNINFMLKFLFLINFLSLGGLPPFLGFFPKWMIINFMLMNKLYIMSFIFMMMSLITLFFYIRIIYSCILFNYLKLKWFKIFLKNNYLYYILFFNLISLMGMIISTMFFI